MSDTYKQLGTEIGELVDRKNAAYGSSFAVAGDFLRLLYPDGLLPEQYKDALLLVRVFDKQMRIATNRDALGESPYQDIAGYGLLGAQLHARKEPAPCPNVDANAADFTSTMADASASHPATAPAQTAETASPSSASVCTTPSKQPSPAASPATDASAPAAKVPASSPVSERFVTRAMVIAEAIKDNQQQLCAHCLRPVADDTTLVIPEKTQIGLKVCSDFCAKALLKDMDRP